jgi:hypothetical protein
LGKTDFLTDESQRFPSLQCGASQLLPGTTTIRHFLVQQRGGTFTNLLLLNFLSRGPRPKKWGKPNWKKKFGGLGVTELRWLRQLEAVPAGKENQQLKKLVADLSAPRWIWISKCYKMC